MMQQAHKRCECGHTLKDHIEFTFHSTICECRHFIAETNTTMWNIKIRKTGKEI